MIIGGLIDEIVLDVIIKSKRMSIMVNGLSVK